MGSRGPIRRVPERSSHRRRSGAEVIELRPAPARSKPPPADRDWLASTRKGWRDFWRSDLASLVTDLDQPALRRLFDLRDELARVREVTRSAMVVKGSMGQLRTNPLLDHAMRLEGAILQLEQGYGLTVSSRVRLGLRLARTTSTLEDLNRRLARTEPGVRPDPRFAALEPDRGPEGEGE